MAEGSSSFAPVNGASQSLQRSNSITSADSQTAQEFIESQLQLEADAREAMPYDFSTCTRSLGPLRQILFACLSCNPPPASLSDPYTPAAVCYSCSIACHGEHTLVELFNKRNFVCDCGTTRLPNSTPCTLQINEATGSKGGVTGEKPAEGNKYNQNFRNRFCGCGEDYDAHQEKGTMFQCLGLGTAEDGGCGEDWWHPECLVGLERKWYEKEKQNGHSNGHSEDTEAQDAPLTDDPPLPPGFPNEDEFDHIICYKCVELNPWIKRYAGAPGFLPAVFFKPATNATLSDTSTGLASSVAAEDSTSRKRKAEDDDGMEGAESSLKRQRSSDDAKVEEKPASDAPSTTTTCTYSALPPAPVGQLSLFLKYDFREHICHCPECFPRLKPHPQLLEEEEAYEPPISEDGDAGAGGQSAGSGSLLDRGEAALSNIDRVRAIEGVMVYNHLKDKVKSFLQPFAESGQAVGAEDIKAYFEKLRGDAEAMKAAAAGANQGGDDSTDNRKEQGGKSLSAY
ncbi:metaphase-anaphase transition protein [Rhizodiscina lignyota]|uniref:Metaphase-anaphase transition protein n=1 Tax=Rhizodiscina lignyota TaxID=1504668 RepID=A0A9P4IMN1_9PEZI|nr:metaphase-anaphase transition protein [Rhizodiscina lignyota]